MRAVSLYLILVTIIAIAGCGGSSTFPSGTDLPDCAAANIPVPPVGGWSVTLQLAAQQFPPSPTNCLNGSYQAQMSLTPFDVVFAPTQPNGQVWLYVEFSVTQSNVIEQNVGEAITVPPNVILPGRKFYIESYYILPPWTPMQGPLVIKGNTLSAAPNGNEAFQIDPGSPVEMALYSVGP